MSIVNDHLPSMKKVHKGIEIMKGIGNFKLLGEKILVNRF